MSAARFLVKNWPLLIVLVVLAWALKGCLRDTKNYPETWPSARGLLIDRKGWWCPNLEGEYRDANWAFAYVFGVGPRRADWGRHVARITQADDGSSLRLDFSLGAEGMRAVRAGEMSMTRGTSFTLTEGTDYRCTMGWLYIRNFDRGGTGGSGFAHEETGIGKDRSGALIVDETVSDDQSIGWGDSQRIPLGRGSRHRWYRWEARDPSDEAEAARLEGITLRRTGFLDGDKVKTWFANFHRQALCVRLVQPEDRVSNPADLTSDFWTRQKPLTVERKPGECPADSDAVGPIRGTMHAMRPTDYRGSVRAYRVEWQYLDRVEEPWHVIDIPDVRELPAPEPREPSL